MDCQLPQVFTSVAGVSVWAPSHKIPLLGYLTLAGPHLLGGRDHKERSESALALSLPRDCDKERSSLISYPWSLQPMSVWPSIPGPPDFSCPYAGGMILSVAGSFLLLCLPTRSAWQVLFGTWFYWRDLFRPVVSLVSRVRSSLAAGAIVPGDEMDLSSWMVRHRLLNGVFDSGLKLRICTLFRCV